ncbi:MAG TPA: protein phosphatase 2C domain-containing protein [Chthoniobacteraceae bacterium]|nr:protein phosphatase 2C domain-containing protein [Chthoniobacteraceae bacterium]
MIAEKDFAGRQSVGKRKRQEDAYAFSDIPGDDGGPGMFVVITDGMGGHTSGEQASEIALESFVDAFHLVEATSTAVRFKSAVVAANQAIADALKESPELTGMGTTLLAAAVTPQGLEWLSVGDSPLYIWRAGTLTRLNADHSFRPMLLEMVESGELKHTDALRHPLKNLLRAALTGRRIDLIDQPKAPIELYEGDVVLAATDGIQTLRDEDICALMTRWAEADAGTLAGGLLQAVLDINYVKQDNTTVAIIKISSAGFAAH